MADPGEDRDAPEPLDAVCAHLQRHGVHARAHRLVRAGAGAGGGLLPDWSPDVPVAEALLSHYARSSWPIRSISATPSRGPGSS